MKRNHLDRGLRTQWWIEWRDKQPVRSALATSLLHHWVPVVKSRLAKNRVEQKTPCSWQGLANAVWRNPETLWRWRNGKHRLSADDFLCLSSVLRVPVTDFFPEPIMWVASATETLCGSAWSNKQFYAYAAYCLSQPRTFNPHLDRDVVANIQESLLYEFKCSSEVELAIMDVGERMGSLLTKWEDELHDD